MMHFSAIDLAAMNGIQTIALREPMFDGSLLSQLDGRDGLVSTDEFRITALAN